MLLIKKKRKLNEGVYRLNTYKEKKIIYIMKELIKN